MSFERVNGAIKVTFVPWHRLWSHSMLMVLLLGLLGALIAPIYGLVMALAVLAHIIQDQLGYLGGSFLFPLKRKRIPGLKWMRSGDAIPNFLVVWVSLAILFLNLDRFSNTPILPVWPYLLGVVVLPCLLFLFFAGWGRLVIRRQQAKTPPTLEPAVIAAVEALDETNEVDI
jgi:hypothetical protein